MKAAPSILVFALAILHDNSNVTAFVGAEPSRNAAAQRYRSQAQGTVPTPKKRGPALSFARQDHQVTDTASTSTTFQKLNDAQTASTQLSSATTTRRSTELGVGANFVTLAQTVAPKLGILTAFALFLSPAKAVYNAVRTSTLGDLNPLPITLMAFSGVVWMTYGIAMQNPYVVLSNSPGCVLSLAYLAGVLPLLSAKPAQLRATQKVIVGGALACFGLFTYLPLSGMSMAAAGKIIGLFASAITLGLFASPLTAIKEVIALRDASSILAPLTVAQVVNTALWTAYGSAVKDAVVWGPNAIGLVLGLVQLGLKIVFRGGAPTQGDYQRLSPNFN